MKIPPSLLLWHERHDVTTIDRQNAHNVRYPGTVFYVTELVSVIPLTESETQTMPALDFAVCSGLKESRDSSMACTTTEIGTKTTGQNQRR